MEISSLATLGFLAAVAVVSHAGDPCAQYEDQTKCDNNSTCTWCACAAVPSSCWPMADAKSLPSGVYVCDNITTVVAEAVSWRALAPEQKKSYTWAHFKSEFAKTYTAEEEGRKQQVFVSNLQEIHLHNADQTKTWTAGVNQFTDLTAQQISSQHKGLKRPSLSKAQVVYPALPEGVSQLPEAIDWRTKGAVTPIKNQGGCGSCWAFSATETVESAVFVATGTLPVLAPQEMVDCVTNPDKCGGTGGCEGATQELGFAYAMLHGMATEADYAYTAHDGTCQMGAGLKGDAIAAGIKGYVKLPANNNTALLTALATTGPVAISVDASFGSYESGVYTGCSDTTSTIDHGVQAVGYGVDPQAGPYFIVRNSWGEAWGDKGYIKLKRTAGGPSPCQVDPNNQDGDGCTDSPKQITVCGECGMLSDSSYPTGAYIAK